jgi:hypothetical protein
MKFPLSSSDAFVEQIKLATEVAFTQFHDKILTPDILELVQDAPELTDKDLGDAVVAILVVAKQRKIDLGEAVLKVLG